ncbi:hypothetical protein PUNSTDRAFT_64709 [Punctularia strigosozonata HHB-11173 SS5]|uniref:uncharacterized protein n=1 Tax=Punctularia strigosozonata (strain HHB-11173) TaxID=741275 RepID=UPI0004416FE0|nr:uncharacterized protein PUNSTDRAFT_64709 [Punctularia strigosozonata HHB-11173 SS5]EIN10588.1 hypothetical protein PUNSTDRAFT_64709 [Punctularia strigosozonata HHB-11173 SS5]
MADLLFPINTERITCGFTTHTADLPAAVKVVNLSDQDLGVHKVTSRTPHNIVYVPRKAVPAYEAFYPEGSVNPAGPVPGGFGFYVAGPTSFATELAHAKEAVLSYSVMFEKEWRWAKGGKLPGIFGGNGEKAYGCTGGRKDDRCSCFDLRLMWRAAGDGEIYAYMPLEDANESSLLRVPPSSKRNPDYGYSVGRGSFQFVAGQWITIAQRVRLNEPGRPDGEMQLWVDGKSVIEVSGLVFRSTDAACIKGIHFQTFFGGHGPDWASPKDQRAWFADISGAVLSS